VALRPRGCAQPLLTYGSFAEYPAAQATLTTFGSIQIKYGRARLKRPPRPKGGWGGAVGVNRRAPWGHPGRWARGRRAPSLRHPHRRRPVRSLRPASPKLTTSTTHRKIDLRREQDASRASCPVRRPPYRIYPGAASVGSSYSPMDGCVINLRPSQPGRNSVAVHSESHPARCVPMAISGRGDPALEQANIHVSQADRHIPTH